MTDLEYSDKVFIRSATEEIMLSIFTLSDKEYNFVFSKSCAEKIVEDILNEFKKDNG